MTINNLITTLQQLVAMPSISSDSRSCHDIITHVHNELAPYNLYIRGDFEATNPWFIATTQDTNEPDILLAAHLDVVPAKEYKIEEKDGKLYGRGAYDMKLAAACYLELFKSRSDALAKLNIGLLFTTDEELGGHCMPNVLATGLRPKMVFIPDGGDNWRVEERAKGFYHTRLTARGKASHGSRPWEGENAVHRLIETLDTLHQSFPSKQPADSTLTISSFHGGEAMNQTPDYATGTIDFRSFSLDDLAEHKRQVSELAQQNNIELEIIQQGDPLILDKESPAIQSFLATLKDFTGQDIQYTESYGGTDGRFFAPYNIPCIIMEPKGGGRHADGEWLDAADFARYYQLIERWIIPQQ
jgi:succinyl-diaminopimelate desuccinylase